jgi:hypothetical protein
MGILDRFKTKRQSTHTTVQPARQLSDFKVKAITKLPEGTAMYCLPSTVYVTNDPRIGAPV